MFVSTLGLDSVVGFSTIVQHALEISGILDEVSAALLAKTRERFLKQVDPDGVPWVPSFAAIRRALHGSGGGTLFDTGRLFHSIQLYLIDENTRAIGTDVPYASKHQNGEDGMVKRVFLGFGEEDSKTAEQIMVTRFKKLTQTVGVGT